MVDGTDPVADGEFLLRFVPPTQLVQDATAPKVQSEQFNKPRFSADREAIKALDDFRKEHAGKHVARFQASACREVGYEVAPDPLQGNESHAIIHTDARGNRLRRMARRLRDAYVELLDPME